MLKLKTVTFPNDHRFPQLFLPLLVSHDQLCLLQLLPHLKEVLELDPPILKITFCIEEILLMNFLFSSTLSCTVNVNVIEREAFFILSLTIGYNFTYPLQS